MEILLKRFKSGDLQVMVRFAKDTNFNVETLEWIPRLEELNLIIEAKDRIMEKKEKG